MVVIAPLRRGSGMQELDHLQNQVDGRHMDGDLPFVTQYQALPELEREGDRHATWRPSSHRDLADPQLASILRKVLARHDCVIAPAS